MPATALAYSFEYGQDSYQDTQGLKGHGTITTMMHSAIQGSPQSPSYDAQQTGSQQPAATQVVTPYVTPAYFEPEAGAGGPSLQQSAQGLITSSEVSTAHDQNHLGGVLEEKNGNVDQSRTALGLDDTGLHAEQIKLLDDFNHAWLALCQKQIEMMTSSQWLAKSQCLVPKVMIKKRGNGLIRLCDGIECYGLVDYQYGVWEEDITAALWDCLDLYEASEKADGSGGSP